MNTPITTPDTTDDPIAEIHEIRRRLAAEHGNDPRRHGESLREQQKQHAGRTVRVQKQVVTPSAGMKSKRPAFIATEERIHNSQTDRNGAKIRAI